MFASQRVLSDSCLFYFLIFPKVLRKILILNSDCSRNSSCHWVFLLLPVCLLPLQKRLDSNPYSHILGHPNGYNHDNCIIFAMLRICCATFQTSSKKSSRDIYWLMDHPTAWERLFPKSGPRAQRVILSTYHQPSASGSPPPSYSTLQHPFRASRQ